MRKLFYYSSLFFFSFTATAESINSEKNLPLANKNQFILELNPLIMANQGLGFNTESTFFSKLSYGFDFEYYNQRTYSSHSVAATKKMFIVAPKVVYYFLTEALKGPFLGGKIIIAHFEASITDTTNSVTFISNFIAPTVYFGYRFILEKHFTISSYVGLGLKNKATQFPVENIPVSELNNSYWNEARQSLNYNNRNTLASYGITIGYIF